jgi:tetratricopeptide (TPR) repeat protein
MITRPNFSQRTTRALGLCISMMLTAAACSPASMDMRLCLPTAVTPLIAQIAKGLADSARPQRAIGLWIGVEARACDDQVRVTALIERSRLYALNFEYDRAIADMDAAVHLTPDDPLVYVERGQRVLLLYEWDRVLDDYNHALMLDPVYADAYYYRAILYASVPEAAEALPAALADFERYLELAPHGYHAARARQYAAVIAAQIAALDAP